MIIGQRYAEGFITTEEGGEPYQAGWYWQRRIGNHVYLFEWMAGEDGRIIIWRRKQGVAPWHLYRDDTGHR